MQANAAIGVTSAEAIKNILAVLSKTDPKKASEVSDKASELTGVLTDQYGKPILGADGKPQPIYRDAAKSTKPTDVQSFEYFQSLTPEAKKEYLKLQGMTPSGAKIGAAGGDVAIPGSEAPLYSGLSTKTATAVRQKVSNYKTEPVVTNFNVVNEGYNFIQSIPDNTTNPADDQGMLYAFAKIMDPNSVVREGEYATVQKYAQSWAQSFGFDAERIFSNAKFLSEEAIKNMKTTIERKFSASRKNYDNVYQEYSRSINDLTGRKDGEKFLVNYGSAFAKQPSVELNPVSLEILGRYGLKP